MNHLDGRRVSAFRGRTFPDWRKDKPIEATARPVYGYALGSHDVILLGIVSVPRLLFLEKDQPK